MPTLRTQPTRIKPEPPLYCHPGDETASGPGEPIPPRQSSAPAAPSGRPDYWTSLHSRADLVPLRGFLVSRNYGREARNVILHQAVVSGLRAGCLQIISPYWLEPCDVIDAELALAQCRDGGLGAVIETLVRSLTSAGFELTCIGNHTAIVTRGGRQYGININDCTASVTPARQLSAAEWSGRNSEV